MNENEEKKDSYCWNDEDIEQIRKDSESDEIENEFMVE